MDDLLEDPLDILTKPRELGSVASLNTKNRMRSVIRLFGIEIVCWNCEEAAEAIAKAIERPRQTPLLLVHVNVHTLRSILTNNDLLKKLQERSLLLLEGIGLKSACLVTKGRAPADTNGTDLFPALLSALQSTRCRLYLLGAGQTLSLLLGKRYMRAGRMLTLLAGGMVVSRVRNSRLSVIKCLVLLQRCSSSVWVLQSRKPWPSSSDP